MSNRSSWLLLILVIFIGAALRFQAISTTVVNNPIRADARIYYFTALNLERWSVFSKAEPSESAPMPDAFVQPGLPFSIAPLIEYPPTERMLFRINTIQAILGTLTILLAFSFFNLFTTTSIALGAALLTAISPHLVVLTTYLLTETLFTFLLTSYMVAFGYALRKENSVLAIVAGCLLGLSALTRATTEYLPLFMLPFLFWLTTRRVFMLAVLPAALTALAIIAAWKLRNLIAIGALSDPTLMVSALHHGIYPEFLFNGIPETRGAPYRFDPFTSQISGAYSILTELVRRATNEPLRYVWWFLIGKQVSLLSWDMIDGMGDIFIYPIEASPYLDRSLFTTTRMAALWLHGPLSIAAVAGCGIVLIRPSWLGLTETKRVPAQLVAVLVLYFFAIHFVGAPYPRYGIPLRPLLYGFGLFTLISLTRKFAPGLRRHKQ